MDKEELLFNKIVGKLTRENKKVKLGKMMTAPALKYKDKVFAFYNQGLMVFKLGNEFDPASYNIKTFAFLSPFKNKPPVKGWYQIPATEKQKWETLAREALKLMSSGKK